jgi:hypothetical protein
MASINTQMHEDSTDGLCSRGFSAGSLRFFALVSDVMIVLRWLPDVLYIDESVLHVILRRPITLVDLYPHYLLKSPPCPHVGTRIEQRQADNFSVIFQSSGHECCNGMAVLYA